MMDIAQFRLDFPEFTDTVKYPDSMITFWSGLAEDFIDSCRWGDSYAKGVELLTAHYISMAAFNVANSGGNSSGGGVISQKNVGKVSISYDTSASTISGAGQLNKSSYGQTYLTLARMIGAGCVQL